MRDSVRMFLFTLCRVSGLAGAFRAMPLHRRQGIADVLLGYLRKSAGVINKPGRSDKGNCVVWLLV